MGPNTSFFAMLSFACVLCLCFCVLQLSRFPEQTQRSQHSKGLVLATCISWLHWHVHQFDARTSQRSWIRRCSDVEEPLNFSDALAARFKVLSEKAPVLQDTEMGFFLQFFAVGKESGRLASWEKHSKEATPTSTIRIQVTVQVHHDTPK